MQKKKLLYTGKVKSVYETDDQRYLIVEFRDDTTAFDGQKHEQIPNKGSINNRISTFIMSALSREGIPTHYVETLSDTEVLVKRLTMIPVECVVRNLAAGSLCRRLGISPQLRLQPPLYELFYKNDALHDPLISSEHALAFGWATEQQLARMRVYSFKINAILEKQFAAADMILVDSKYEFGVDAGGEVCLGDEISPDSCRIWDSKTGASMDKDRFRQDLGGLMEAYEAVASRLEGV